MNVSKFINFGLNQSAEHSFLFLRHEIPVRLANIMTELRLLPTELQETIGCTLISKMYHDSFVDMLSFAERDPKDPAALEEFMRQLDNIRRRHGDVVTIMAKAIFEVKCRYVEGPDGHFPKHVARNIQYFLDRLYTSRISTRMLINQHTALFGANGNGKCNGGIGSDGKYKVVGSIDPHCDVPEVVEKAYDNARFLCEQYYMTAPELTLRTHDLSVAGTRIAFDADAPDDDKRDHIECVYVPAHLYHIVFELFKNAMRATIEHYGEDAKRIPAVNVIVVKTADDVTIKISDRGGGIPMKDMKKVFQYLYTTAPNPIITSSADDPSSKMDGTLGDVPLAGYGYGLPLSRLYARYLAGNLKLYSCDGYGTDAVLTLQSNASKAQERLPIYNDHGAKKIYDSQSVADDWTDKE